jgi:hypothetical protein
VTKLGITTHHTGGARRVKGLLIRGKHKQRPMSQPQIVLIAILYYNGEVEKEGGRE